MRPVSLRSLTRPRLYSSASLSVAPNPPIVGQPTLLSLAIANPAPTPATVQAIAFKIAHFGMGMLWESLPPLGPFTLVAGETATITQPWTPTQGGHRCVAATITLPDRELMVQRNLDVLQATADEDQWRRVFHVGNPTATRAPVAIMLSESDDIAYDLRINDHPWHAEHPFLLDPGDVLQAELRLRARTDDAIDAAQFIEVTLGGHFLDGILIALHRPAAQRRYAGFTAASRDVHARARVLVHA